MPVGMGARAALRISFRREDAAALRYNDEPRGRTGTPSREMI